MRAFDHELWLCFFAGIVRQCARPSEWSRSPASRSQTAAAATSGGSVAADERHIAAPVPEEARERA
jgi:hypothetical protein